MRTRGLRTADRVIHLVPGGGLMAHEGLDGGHTLAKHVGKSEEFLRDRLAAEPGIKAASTFHDRQTARECLVRIHSSHWNTLGAQTKPDDRNRFPYPHCDGDPMKQYPALEQLLGGYLHEDWADDYADFSQAIDAFVEHQPSYAPAAPGEITQLLGECDSDAVLEQRLDDLGLVYYPPGLGWSSYRSWMLAVANRLEEALRTSPAA